MNGLSLRSKIILVGAFLLFVPSIVFMLIVYFKTLKTMENISKEQFIQNAYSMSSMLNLSLVKKLEFINNIAVDPVFVTEAERGSPIQTQAKLADYYDKMRQDLEDIGTFDRNGILRTDGTDGSKVGIDISDRRYYSAVRSGKNAISQLVNSKATGNPVFIVGAPIFSSQKKVAGGVMAVMKADYLIEYVNSLKLGKTGYAFLVNNRGDLLIHPYRKDLLYRNVGTVPTLEGFITKFAQSPMGVIEYRFEKKNKLCGYAQIPITGWYLVVTQDKNETMQLAYANTKYTIIFACSFMILGFVFIVFYSSQISSPVQTNLTRLNTAVSQAEEAIIIMDEHLKLQFHNAAATKLIQGEPLLGAQFELQKIDRDELESILRQVKKEEAWNGRVELQADGASCVMDLTITQVNGEKKGQKSFLLIGRDISSELQLQQQILQSQKMDAIGTLASGISHDFNNILGGIFGYIELSLVSLDEPETLEEYLGQIRKASLRARDLIDHIMAFSRQDDQEVKHISFKYIIEDSLRLIRASLPSSIEIKKDLKSSASILGDSTAVHQVIMNLCANAGYAMRSKGGVLRLDLEEINNNEIKKLYPNAATGKYLRLIISDTGDGIKSEILDKIFNPFFTTKPQGEGTGIGLSTVHNIIKNMKGQISVSSKTGEGTAIRIYLPVSQIEENLSEDTLIKDFPGGHEHLLVIDDEVSIVESTKKRFEKLGYKTSTYVDSIEALDAFKKNPDSYDLILTDHTMPKMLGLDLAKEVRKIRTDIPIIISSGNLMVDREIKKMKNVHFLKKPVLTLDLTVRIRDALDTSQP